MKTIIILKWTLLFVVTPLSLMSGSAENPAFALPLTADLLNQHSEWWPYEVRLRGGEGKMFPGTLIRVEGADAIVDFGRDGVRTVALDETDIFDRAGAIRRGDSVKVLPNFVRMTANYFLHLEPDGARRVIKAEEIAASKGYFILYAGEEVKDQRLLKRLNDFSSIASNKACPVLIIPTDPVFYRILDMHEDDFKPYFASVSMSVVLGDVLRHEPSSDGCTLVLIDPEGKVLDSWSTGDDSTAAFVRMLDEVQSALSTSELGWGLENAQHRIGRD